MAITATGQQKLSKILALQDIDSLVATLETIHYNPYLHITKTAFHKNVTEIKHSIPDTIEFKDYLLKLYKITASLQDGHAMPAIVQPALRSELVGANFLPLKLVVDNKKVYAGSRGIFSLPPDAQIKHINGLSLEKSLLELEQLLGGSKNFTQEMAAKLLSYFLFLQGVQPPFTIEYITSTKQTKKDKINNGITFIEMIHISMPHLKEQNSFRVMSHEGAYLNFISMNGDLQQWGSFLDSAFIEMRAMEIKNLYIDIRNNSGGNSLFGNYLLAYLTKEKFLFSSGKCWKISARMKQYQQQNGSFNKEYQSRETGTNWCYDKCIPEENPVIADSIFNGKVYLLTSPFTFSSANMLADAFKTFHLGTIIGESTGEYTNDFGEVMQFELPNSKIKIQTTTSFEYGADCDKTSFHTVSPDIIIKPSLDDKIRGNDAVMRYLLKVK
ncbi:hypothetical protein GCM10023092_03880 [Rurimicrobium arvi]|uniref:Tail specific protease domain-containing protein n=2 Tax=Rurimicrobium arvi TaxID=2049916 RepID=A0ABP8MI99_9BACT